MSTLPLPTRIRYERAAQVYLAGLTLENFMEATPQAKQREITLESLALVKARRPEVQVFNELLVQYPKGRKGEEIGQIEPDNMVVLSDKPVQAEGSYNLPVEKIRPFWVLEYVSRTNHRKDYESSFVKYEQELKVPYYLVFAPEIQEMNFFKLTKGKYLSVRANKNGRFAIPKLALELAVLDGWVRYWYEGELLPLPAELQRQLDETRKELAQERLRTRQAMHRADEQAHRADEQARRADEERVARLAAEQELARLRVELGRARGRNGNG